ncbi:MAG: hypothetical protein HON94_15235 [Methylococcales bacterium]|jgi:hypothetical protein|nr:hypothetical protein [Methylococcales bacterium]MBT7408513.1 hypothetical protein [Methylococcales bacterium]
MWHKVANVGDIQLGKMQRYHDNGKNYCWFNLISRKPAEEPANESI